MAKPTRGFLGRGKAARDPRLPPGQYDAGDQWPVLNAEVTPQPDLASWSFSVEGLVAHSTTWTWEEIHAAARVRVFRRHPLRDHLVQAGSAIQRRLRRHASWHRRIGTGCHPRAGFLEHRVHDQPAASRCHRWSSLGGLGIRGHTAADRTRWTGTPLGPASLFLEECEMGGRIAGPRPRRTRILGAQRLPRSGRSVARAAVPG